MPTGTARLFADQPLAEWLSGVRRAVANFLNGIDPDTFLTRSDEDLLDDAVAKATVVTPRVDRDRIEQLPVKEAVWNDMDTFLGRPIQRRGAEITILIPFDGDSEIFTRRTNQRRLREVYADIGPHELRFTWRGQEANADIVRAHFDDFLSYVEEHLAWAAPEIDQHHTAVRSEMPELIKQRRARLLADRKVQAELGFAVRRRPDAEKYAVPITRRKLTPSRPAAKRSVFKPEWTMLDKDYEAALEVIANMRNAFERSPSTTAKLDEEEIRDLILISLNAQFEGQAAGEVFNCLGKTDILVRVEDRNVFIGECKWWDGPAMIATTLDQLLGYVAWRDTKAALLLFIRNLDVSAVISKAVTEIEKHANYKRSGKHAGEGRFDFTLHAVGDSDREIHLALIPFAMRADR